MSQLQISLGFVAINSGFLCAYVRGAWLDDVVFALRRVHRIRSTWSTPNPDRYPGLRV